MPKKLSNQDLLDTDKLIELNKEYSELTPIVQVINQFNSNKKDLINLKDLLEDDDDSIICPPLIPIIGPSLPSAVAKSKSPSPSISTACTEFAPSVDEDMMCSSNSIE